MNDGTDLNSYDLLCPWDNNILITKNYTQTSGFSDLKDCQLLQSEIGDSWLEKKKPGQKKSQENKVKAFTCSHCYKDFSSRNSLRVHLRVHSGNKAYCCEHCGKLFSHKATLIGHLTKIHSINLESGHRCTICGKLFARKNAVKVHMAIHIGFKPFSCKICSKSFSQKVTRDIHVLTHTGKYDYSCTKCSRKFPSLYKLNYHMKSHNVPEYHCLLCLKLFTNKGDLDKHCESHKTTSQIVQNGEPGKNVKLHDINLKSSLYCTKPVNNTNNNEKLGSDEHPTFQLENNLHHVLKKKFLCNFCGCNFGERRSLLHHIKMRHSVVPSFRHSCSMCQKSFTQKSKLALHIKRHTEVRDK